MIMIGKAEMARVESGNPKGSYSTSETIKMTKNQ